MRLAKSKLGCDWNWNLTFGDDKMKRHENEIFPHGEPLSEE
jgi:hypothetical protein